MKKVISWILVCIMVFGNIAIAVDGDETTYYPVSENSAEILQSLGMLSGTDKGLELNRKVTRAEAVVLLYRIQKATPQEEFNGCFDDVKADHWAASAIECAKRDGFINGTGNKTFTPNRPVSGLEFTKMILASMGYSGITIDNAYDKGIETGLLRDELLKNTVKDNKQLLRGEIAYLCHSALLTPLTSGTVLFKKLIEDGKLSEYDVDGILYPAKDKSFADKLSKHMPKDKNYMFSPLSIKMALAMAANGASGETKDEMLKVLNIQDLDAYNTFAKDFMEKFTSTDIIQMNIANSIWVNTDQSPAKFLESYKNKVNEFYKATADEVNDKNAVETINGWVEKQTNGKIDSILKDSDFWACLVNAIYFKATWQNQFKKEYTRKDEFTDRKGKKKKIDFMNQTEDFNYYEEEGLKIVELPYKITDGKYKVKDIQPSMYLILSDNEDIDAEYILNTKKLENRLVDLSMPKFKSEWCENIKDILKEMGMPKAFSDYAEFDNMMDNPLKDVMPLRILDVFHKTYIDVDEYGTEAAGVTAIPAVGGCALPSQPVKFKADRPFTYVIRDNISGDILFMGEYAYAE